MSRFKTRKRYRLTFVNENTFNAVWSVKLSRLKVWLLTAVTVAAIAALVSWILVGTPISALLPGYLRPEQRREHVRNTARVDSLAEAMAEQRAYYDNINRILQGEELIDSPAVAAEAVQVTDTLLTASAAERRFVEQWEERERFNLSVLTPLAAEGMTFHSPLPSSARPDTVTGQRVQTLRMNAPRHVPVSAIYAGTVVDTHPVDGEGVCVTVVHPNNFLSRYRGLGSAFVLPGAKVNSGDALGLTSDMAARPFLFELWHNGVSVNPLELIAF